MINTIIFDVGKVLLHFEWEAYLHRFGYDEKTYEILADAIFRSDAWSEGDSTYMSYETWTNNFIKNAPDYEADIRKICEHVEDCLYPYDYVLDWLEYYYDLGYRMYFLSNLSFPIRDKCREKLSFLEALDGGIYSYEVNCMKPGKKIYKLLMEQYHIAPHEAIFFDDNEANISTAKELGIRAVLFSEEMAVNEMKLIKLQKKGIEAMTKVVKFGGSSLASAEQFKKVEKIIKADPARKYVVPSAPGKRYTTDTKVTDMLYGCYAKAINGENFSEDLEKIKSRYNDIIEGLGLALSLDSEFAEIKKQFQAKAGEQYAASRGEYLNGIVMAKYLGYEFIDSATVIRFDEDGSYDREMTKELMGKRLTDVEHAVIPGFYGGTADGTVKTFSRGGSDITGSIVSSVVQADTYENWTDVSGFLIADPRIVRNPEAIEIITYRELRELSYMGATVLHEDAIFPVQQEGIPINIRNTNAPDDPGTYIVENTCRQSKYIITGVAGKEGFAALNIEKAKMNTEVGFCRSVLDVFARHGISIEHMPSGIDTMSVFVHQSEFEEKEQKVLSDIRKEIAPDHIELESDLALIAVVGRGMKATRGTAGRIFSALAHANINVKMIDQGSSELNIIIGVRNQDFRSAIKSIYDIFVTAGI